MSPSTRPARTAVDDFLEKLPREKLIEMLYAYASLYQKLDGFWYLSIMERWGNKEALNCDVRVWQRVTGYEIKLIQKALGLEGRQDISAFLTIFGAEPISLITTYTTEKRNDCEFIITVDTCPILTALEKEGKGREADICRLMDVVIFTRYAEHFGSGIKIEPQTLPPRQNRSGICCQWRLTSLRPEEGPLPVPGLDRDRISDRELIELIKTYCRLYQVMDAHWYISIRERWGNDAGMDRDFWVWERLPKSEVEAVSKIFNLNGRRDIDAFVKLFLTVPMGMTVDYRVEKLSKNEAIVTFTHCPVLRALEKEGEGREKDICGDLDVRIFNLYARLFNPGIQVTALKLPPRRDESEPACNWRFFATPATGQFVT